MDTSSDQKDVRSRLLTAALDCFLADEYHKVITRTIAEKAGANIAMIRYYFGSKEGLYEEMIRETLAPLLDALDGPSLTSVADIEGFLSLYYRTMSSRPEFPKLILKVLALNQGPGRRFILQLLERGRADAVKKVEALQADNAEVKHLDADVVRLAFISLAMTPMLLKDIFEEQTGRPMDEIFFFDVARFNGLLLATGLAAYLNLGECHDAST